VLPASRPALPRHTSNSQTANPRHTKTTRPHHRSPTSRQACDAWFVPATRHLSFSVEESACACVLNSDQKTTTTHTHTHTHTHADSHTALCVCVRACVRDCVRACVCVCARTLQFRVCAPPYARGPSPSSFDGHDATAANTSRQQPAARVVCLLDPRSLSLSRARARLLGRTRSRFYPSGLLACAPSPATHAPIHKVANERPHTSVSRSPPIAAVAAVWFVDPNHPRPLIIWQTHKQQRPFRRWTRTLVFRCFFLQTQRVQQQHPATHHRQTRTKFYPGISNIFI
jgi:hypothetical protein